MGGERGGVMLSRGTRVFSGFISLIFLSLLFAPLAFGDCGKITFDCKNGDSKGTVNGESFTINCGANTKSKSGTLKSSPCVGSSFPCMAGKPCMEMDGANKIHKTNCGSGGQPATGNLSTAGCVTMDTKDY